ncbi:hypothetical protein BDP81DRAFT_421364 [Colletotrichum phormii]|uniref:Uncharacterized protein n=1 Tax=Colletotrichum phormii TaxID=359342 RepID=A0AAI9ZZV3_9PEZI|nr:uncharacterized protein BDP81DRAFT_421364 [Colletotrichum phormii]KAK1639587.1 hypothetical protein BDP81DRAFT_421364 [Colletotrichum phormii]
MSSILAFSLASANLEQGYPEARPRPGVSRATRPPQSACSICAPSRQSPVSVLTKDPECRLIKC